jgi:hypothetical protein
MKKVGLELTHIIGPKAGHRYEPGAKAEVNRRIDAIVEKGRKRTPEEIRFVTYSLRYNRCGWIRVERLGRHWEQNVVHGQLTKEGEQPGIRIEFTPGVMVTIVFPAGEWPFPADREPVLEVRWLQDWQRANNEPVKWKLTKPGNGKPFRLSFTVDRFGNIFYPDASRAGLVKRSGLQGPIDDAFMDRFLMVRPTGKPMNEKVGAWAAGEMNHAVTHWRRQFRGDAPVKDDSAVTDADIASSSLILWGDPSSNAVLAKIADKLPVKWTKDGVVLGDKTYDVGTHVPVLIFPNPLNPNKYVVLNSGFTFREYDYLNNARQVPKLPDYAVLDVTTPPNSRWPGKVVRAGFFGEKWELLPDDGK